MAQHKRIQKDGPYGAKNAVQNFSMQLKEDEFFKEVKIRSGFIVDAIGFTIGGPGGQSDTYMFGGEGGQLYKINLHAGEYITGISGIYKGSFISQLRIHTTLHPEGHGPYGTDQLKGGCTFKSTPLDKNDSIVGFFGTAYDNLVSIGLYVDKESQTTTVEKHGPFGYQTGKQWSMMLEPCENFREMIIKTGAIVDALTFVTTKTRQKFGGDGGNAEHKVTLQPGEYITNVSGWIGEWHQNRCLTKLKIHTNKRVDGYGPFGGGPHTNYLSEFRSQVPSDGRVVGFFGTTHGNYVESIGLYVKQ